MYYTVLYRVGKKVFVCILSQKLRNVHLTKRLITKRFQFGMFNLFLKSTWMQLGKLQSQTYQKDHKSSIGGHCMREKEQMGAFSINPKNLTHFPFISLLECCVAETFCGTIVLWCGCCVVVTFCGGKVVLWGVL